MSSKQSPLAAELERAGAAWILPWFDDAAAAAFEKKIADQRREQLTAQRGLQGPALDRAMAAAPQAAYLDVKAPLRHELGHVWFVGAFWGRQALHNMGRGPRPVALRRSRPRLA